MADTDSGQFMSSGIPSDFKPKGLSGQRVPDKKPKTTCCVEGCERGIHHYGPTCWVHERSPHLAAPYSVSENVKPEQAPTPTCPECGGSGVYRGMNSRSWPCGRCKTTNITPEKVNLGDARIVQTMEASTPDPMRHATPEALGAMRDRTTTNLAERRIKHTPTGPCRSTECPGHHAFDDGDRADVRVADWLRHDAEVGVPFDVASSGDFHAIAKAMCHALADAIDRGEHHA